MSFRPCDSDDFLTDAAPDFIVTIAAAPELTVFQIEREVANAPVDEDAIGAVLSALEDEPVDAAPVKRRARRAKKEEA